MIGKQVSIFLVAAFLGVVVLGMGLLAFGLIEIPVRQEKCYGDFSRVDAVAATLDADG